MDLTTYKGNQRIDPSDILNFLENFILPAIGGGGGGGGDASAANQLVQIDWADQTYTKLLDVVNILVSGLNPIAPILNTMLTNDIGYSDIMATKAKQDDIIQALANGFGSVTQFLVPLATEQTLNGVITTIQSQLPTLGNIDVNTNNSSVLLTQLLASSNSILSFQSSIEQILQEIVNGQGILQGLLQGIQQNTTDSKNSLQSIDANIQALLNGFTNGTFSITSL
jgi:hypothetical protein